VELSDEELPELVAGQFRSIASGNRPWSLDGGHGALTAALRIRCYAARLCADRCANAGAWGIKALGGYLAGRQAWRKHDAVG